MFPRAATTTRWVETVVDRRIWPFIMMIGFLGWIVMKEVHLPSTLMGACAAMGMLGLVMTGVQHPELPFYVLVVYLPFSRELAGGFGTDTYAFNLTNMLTLLVLGAYALNRMSKSKPLFQAAPMNFIVFFFCVLGAISLLQGGFTYGSWYVWEYVTPLKRWLTPIFFYFLALWVVRDKQTLKTVVVLMMVVVTVVAIMAIRDYMNSGDASLEKARVGGIADQPNTLGAFFVYYMFFFLAFFLVYPKKFKTWMLLIPFALSFRGIMVTFSRGAYLGFAAGGLAACWHRKKVLFVVAASVLLFAIYNPWLLPAGIRYRMGQTIQSKEAFEEGNVAQSLESSSANRLVIWQGAKEMIRDHPWWGVGYGTFPYYIMSYTGGKLREPADAHNSYLLIAAEMGIPTLVVFFIILLLTWWYTYWLYRRTTDRSLKAITLGFLAGLFGLLVVNCFGSRMDDQAVSSYFWILCGLVMRGVVMYRQEASAEAKVRRAARKAQLQLA